eukprot:c5938_g1_i1.p1 GENE.c5938_g1_i1~~c5938_g1_i1.p1  ORF type:complete len:396 (+),score=97.33 c5938_g1_i1:90-1190(+)
MVDMAKLEHYLKAHIPRIHGNLSLHKFVYGQSNPTFLLKCTSSGGSDQVDKEDVFVIRKQPAGQLVKSAHRVDREYRIISVLSERNFEVPNVLHLCMDPSVIGSSFYVMSFVKGRIPENSLRNIPDTQRKDVMRSIVRTLGKLHSFDVRQLGLLEPSNPFGKEGKFYERQLATLTEVSRQQIQNSPVPPIPSLPLLLELFNSHSPSPLTTIVHGDYKPDNVIIHPALPQVSAIVDWELSTLGHPLSDLANLCMPFHTRNILPLYPSFENVPETLTEAEVMEEYCRVTGMGYPIPDWEFYVAFAFFRFAVIAQGVAARAARGQASDVNADKSLFVTAVIKSSAIALELLQNNTTASSATKSNAVAKL